MLTLSDTLSCHKIITWMIKGIPCIDLVVSQKLKTDKECYASWSFLKNINFHISYLDLRDF